jgi:hypothetical protein
MMGKGKEEVRRQKEEVRRKKEEGRMRMERIGDWGVI